MVIFSGPLHHHTLPCTKTPITGDPFFRRECGRGLLPRPRNISFSNLTGSHSLQMPASHRSLFPRMAVASNVSEDSDDMFDDLFDKYGNAVFRRIDEKSASTEVDDDDAESLAFALALAKVARDVKAADIRLLFVKPLVYWTRFFIIATAFSRPQIDAIRTRIRDLARTQYGRTPTGDTKPNSWTLLDLGDVVVHIFLPPQRDFYNLEEFYGNATPIELPFEDQQPFRNYQD